MLYACTEMEIERYDWISAEDSCPTCFGHAGSGP